MGSRFANTASARRSLGNGAARKPRRTGGCRANLAGGEKIEASGGGGGDPEEIERDSA